MYINSFYRSMLLMGLTFSLPLGIFTAPVFAQTADLQQNIIVSPVGAGIYNFPAENITYNSKEGTLIYKGVTYTGSEVHVVNSDIGKQVTVLVRSPLLISSTKFTLLLPNDTSLSTSNKITAVGITVVTVVATIPQRINTTYDLLQGTVTE